MMRSKSSKNQKIQAIGFLQKMTEQSEEKSSSVHEV